MRVLIIDHGGFQLQTRKMLIEQEIGEGEVDAVSTLGELYLTFQKGKYNVIVIDHAIENGQQFVDHILQNDPMQSILVVSDAIHCVVQRCCDCVANHDIRRLFNPTPIKNIVRMIQGFKGYRCDHYDAETDKIK